MRDGVAGEDDGVELHGTHDGLEAFADIGGGGEAGGGLLFEAAQDDAIRARRGGSGTISRMLGGSANWMARMVWNSGASGR